jgi:hypothetical protein
MTKQPGDTQHAIATRYIRFANDEALGKSPLYETLARGVAGDPDILAFLSTLPAEKQQPNLLLAAVRHRFGTPADWSAFGTTLLANLDAVRATMLTHSTQTNEPARCATLLPALATLPQPLALIEVGASAGLCLLPDRYAYDYGRKSIVPSTSSGDVPVFTCAASETTPLPAAMPEVVWRAGLDLNPLDVTDPAQTAWLEALVWPEQSQRLHRLRAAIKLAAAARPNVRKGSLLHDDLERLCAEAPKSATLVIFHTAVLAYIADRSLRERFSDRAMALCPFWISNEAPRVFPKIAGRTHPDSKPGRFLLAVNGAPVAWTEPHGAAIEWIPDGPPS